MGATLTKTQKGVRTMAAMENMREVNSVAGPSYMEEVWTADGKHLVQLGSFASREGARRAWGIYAREYPGLDRYRMVITEAQVRGKTYYRVSAGGLERADARSMCSTVKARGQGCFAWAEGRPLPGAVDTGVRMARR